jgi:hypothetical protein
MAQISFRRLAKARENIGGMCWAITIPGVDAGNLVSTEAMASVPPVEAPMAITMSPGSGGRTAAVAGGALGSAGRAGGSDRRTRDDAAARILDASEWRNSPTE